MADLLLPFGGLFQHVGKNFFLNFVSSYFSLESNGLRRLYSNKDLDRKKELKKLNQVWWFALISLNFYRIFLQEKSLINRLALADT